jgi:hypothetical protein
VQTYALFATFSFYRSLQTPGYFRLPAPPPTDQNGKEDGDGFDKQRPWVRIRAFGSRLSIFNRRLAIAMRYTLVNAFLVAAFGALQIADVHTTQRVLANGGWEANPVGLLAMAYLGSYWPIPKLALMAVCAVIMVRWKPGYVAPFVALMSLVVANNAIWAYS